MASPTLPPPPQKSIPRTKWLRITKQTPPCAICGKPDWCMVSEDGTRALCARSESAHPAGAAGWIHSLDGTEVKGGCGTPFKAHMPPPEGTSDQKPAGPEQRHTVYATLLDCLTLSKSHLENLRSRAIPDEVIAFNGYRTLPEGHREALTAKVKQDVEGVAGVPGFYKKGKKPSLNGAAGLLIPVRGADCLIAGMQIRRDNANGGGKYVWLSSAELPRGVGSGSPAHVAMPMDVRTTDIVFITEGALKADVIAHFMGCPVIGVAGVSSWRRAVHIAAALLPRKIILGYDMDQYTNEAVRKHASDLEQAMIFNHFKVFRASWDAAYKGLDDYLATGAANITYQPVNLVKTATNRPYKELDAKSNKRAWAGVNALKNKAPHITGPDALPPMAFHECGCVYCEAARKYQAEVAADILLGVMS